MEHDADGDRAGPGAQPSLPQDEVAGYRRTGLIGLLRVFVDFAGLLDLSIERALVLLVQAEAFQLEVPVEFADFSGIFAPGGNYLYKCLQENFVAEDFLEFLAGVGADFLEHVALVADEDFLLRVALDVERGHDPDELGTFFVFFDENGQRVGNFVIHGLNGFLADDFCGEEALGLIGDLVLGKVRIGFRKLAENFFLQIGDADAFERGDRDDRREREGLVEGFNHRQEFWFWQAIHFIQDKNGFAPKALRLFQEHGIAQRADGGGVDHEEKEIDAFYGGGDFVHHLAAEGGVCVVETGRVDEDDLTFGACDDALDAVAGGLRLRGDDGDFLADEAIEERGFAGIGAADDGDEAGTVRFFRFGANGLGHCWMVERRMRVARALVGCVVV